MAEPSPAGTPSGVGSDNLGSDFIQSMSRSINLIRTSMSVITSVSRVVNSDASLLVNSIARWADSASLISDIPRKRYPNIPTTADTTLTRKMFTNWFLNVPPQ